MKDLSKVVVKFIVSFLVTIVGTILARSCHTKRYRRGPRKKYRWISAEGWDMVRRRFPLASELEYPAGTRPCSICQEQVGARSRFRPPRAGHDSLIRVKNVAILLMYTVAYFQRNLFATRNTVTKPYLVSNLNRPYSTVLATRLVREYVV